MASRASLELAAGHVQIAGRRVAVRAAGEGGRVQVGDDGGPILRPPTFGERTRLVAAALGAAGPAAALASALVATLRERVGPCDADVERVVALLLAGAGDDGPALVETAALVGRATATPLPAVEALEATQVDFYARALTNDSEQDDGWHRVVLAPPPTPATTAAEASSDALVVQQLAEALLARGRARGSAALRQAAASTPANASAHPADADAGAWASEPAAGATAAASPSGHGHVALASGPRPSGSTDAASGTTGRTPVRPPIPDRPAALQSNVGDAAQAASVQTTHRSAGHAAHVDTPLLRFCQPLTASASPAPRHPGPERECAGGVPSSLPPAPVALAEGRERPAPWEPVPWRLERRAMNGEAEHRERSPRTATTDAAAPASPGSNGALTPRQTHATSLPPVADDDLADRVAESLRREAARRGLVP